MQSILSIVLILSFSILTSFVINEENPTNATTLDKCSNYAQIKTDEVTGRQVVISKNRIELSDTESANPFSVLISRQGFEMLLIVTAKDGTCIKKDTDVRLKLEGNKFMNFNSSNGNNCKGQLNLSFGGIYGNLNDFMNIANSNVQEIVFSDRDDETIKLRLSQKQSSELKNTIDCIMAANL